MPAYKEEKPTPLMIGRIRDDAMNEDTTGGDDDEDSVLSRIYLHAIGTTLQTRMKLELSLTLDIDTCPFPPPPSGAVSLLCREEASSQSAAHYL